MPAGWRGIRARGLGALVLLNDETQAAREATKTSTARLQTFPSADFGCLWHADGDAIAWYRRPLREAGAATPFRVAGLRALPRVDIAAGYGRVDGAGDRGLRGRGGGGHRHRRLRPGLRDAGDGGGHGGGGGAGRRRRV